ncbi:hypothetical protein BGZ63DRAFT_404235 [Mariannaea sp. PMI_226]|nr:hypothetical protein BGZ63DRAFT_404235 [Mariannaea sp. PMI_226]
MTGFLLEICVAHRCSLVLLDDSRHFRPTQHRALATRPAVAAARQRRRRAFRAPVTLLQRRRIIVGYSSFTNNFDSGLDMAPPLEARRRYSVADTTPADTALPASTLNSNTAPTTSPMSAAIRGFNSEENELNSSHTRQNSVASTTSMLSRSASVEDGPARPGHKRAQSSVCRQVNRLSLTLPIAPPTSDPSRPTPTSAAKSSIPPTPIDSTAASPSDANEFIIAIAAQERRVLELREELARAEADLNLLKKKWSAKDAAHKRAGMKSATTTRSTAAASSNDESAAARRSLDSERRKLLQQTQSQATTPQSRRKVFKGGHTRTLSLLSPAKDSGFSLHDEQPDQESVQLPSIERRAAQLTNPNLSKRASWQPRTQQNLTGVNVPGVPQLVEDFKLGLRAFVEDIRQITVGDEPINGQNTRSTSSEQRNGANRDSTNQDTIRPSHPLRPKVSTVFEPPHSVESTPTPSNKAETVVKEKQEKPKGKTKHFSWTPLAVDALDDNDWSNWESPSSSKTSRWSGSTMGSSIDDIPDEESQNTTPSKQKSTGFDTPLLSPKLEEILPNMVNRLTPSSIKRTATNLMDEWEKSLSEPLSQRQPNFRD